MPDDLDHPRCDPESGDETLDMAMGLAFAAGAAVAILEELRVPTLVATNDEPDADVLIFQLVSDGTVSISDMARVLIHASGADRVAICFEGWAYNGELTPENEANLRRGRLPVGTIRPSQHPDRYDVLTLIGQIRDRPLVHRSWRIDPDPAESGRRRLTREQWSPDAMLPPSAFSPLFIGADRVRELVRKHAALARLRDTTRARRN